MKFMSTLNKRLKLSGPEAIVKGISSDGGLFVPESFPAVTKSEFNAMLDMEYYERAAFIIGKYLPELTDLKEYCRKAYSRFDGDAAPLVKVDDGLYFLELWHGPTHAFKDIALTLLPYLMTGSKEYLGVEEKTLILVATSGDTGKAALEGFKDVKGTDIIVFYPQDGVSDLQKMQMMTQEGGNVFVSAIKGNFDDAQTAVKKVFADKESEERLRDVGYELSSANSINFGRLVPQIVYYFSAYLDLMDAGQINYGDKINFTVPSGNFGNILAGYYAKQMGLPVGKLICASNKNNVLTEFFHNGEYNRNREFHKTSSPSMDILISSNLERLIFELSGRNDEVTLERISALKANGSYKISDNELAVLNQTFWANYADEDEVFETIGAVFEDEGYIMDTHTAVAAAVSDEYFAITEDETPTVIVSTASPYKFVSDVLRALEINPSGDELKNLKKLEDETALPLPDSLKDLPKMKKIFVGSVEKDDVKRVVLDYVSKK